VVQTLLARADAHALVWPAAPAGRAAPGRDPGGREERKRKRKRRGKRISLQPLEEEKIGEGRG